MLELLTLLDQFRFLSLNCFLLQLRFLNASTFQAYLLDHLSQFFSYFSSFEKVFVIIIAVSVLLKTFSGVLYRNWLNSHPFCWMLLYTRFGCFFYVEFTNKNIYNFYNRFLHENDFFYFFNFITDFLFVACCSKHWNKKQSDSQLES